MKVFSTFLSVLLIATMAWVDADELTTEKLLELMENIPPEYAYLESNLYFYLIRKDNPSSFPYPDFITGYEGDSVALEMTITQGHALSPTVETDIASVFNSIQEVEWMCDNVVSIPSSQLTWPTLVGGIDETLGTEECNLLFISKYFSPRTAPPVEEPVQEPPAEEPIQESQTPEEESVEGDRKRKLTVANQNTQVQGLFRTQLDQYIAQSGMTGAGVTIGILSNSANAVNANTGNTADLNALIAAGIVSIVGRTVTVLQDSNLPTDTNEGAAMINIIAQMCPRCNIIFATANGGELNFANNIRALATAGAQVIVDDVLYFAEEVFQEGLVEQAVTTVTQAGVLYFSAAANNGNIASGRRTTFLGQWNPVPIGSGRLEQDFVNPGGQLGNTFITNQILVNGDQRLVLQWSTPSSTGVNVAIRMNFFVENVANPGITLFMGSCAAQRSSCIAAFPNNFPIGNFLVRVIRPNGGGAFPAPIIPADQRIFLAAGSAGFGQVAFNRFTPGASYGHNAPFQGFGVAAVSTNLLTVPFTTANVVEGFSSDGQTPRCFLPNGVYIGCTNKIQPLVTGPDRVTTSVVSGFNPFSGTSAAAPAVASMVAVFKQRFGAFLTPTVLRNALQSQEATLDIMAPNYDNAAGFGILMAPLLNQQLLRQQRLANCIPISPLLGEALLVNYGCNGLDDNCNGIVDECAEDVIGPHIKVSEYSYGSQCFTNQAAASAFFITNTLVEDDCQPLSRRINGAVVTQPPPTFTGFVPKCDASTAIISAQDVCGNVATDQIMFNFDNSLPTLTVDKTKIKDHKCFIDQEIAENFILTNSKTTDDCTATNLIDLSIFSFVKDCKNSKATVKAVDLCENVKTEDVQFNFDDGKPLVTIAPLADKCYTSTAYLEAAIKDKTTLSDECTAVADLKAFTSINEQCEESTATVYATDLCGNVGSNMVKFNFDNKPPEILVSEYSLGSKWLTNADYAKLFFLTNTFTTDDCSSQADTKVTFTNLFKNCAASTAVITATDKCGNTAVDPIMFLYDDDRPTVSVSVAKSSFILSEDKVKKGLVDVGLTIAATDDCTLNPNVTVLVYSDELYDKAVEDWSARTVQLSRIETSPGVITGWKLLVAVEAFKVCNYGPYYCGGTTKVEGDGRVYTIQVCATDEAGNRYCVEKTVSVGFKNTAAISGGKLYLLAEDSISKFRTL